MPNQEFKYLSGAALSDAKCTGVIFRFLDYETKVMKKEISPEDLSNMVLAESSKSSCTSVTFLFRNRDHMKLRMFDYASSDEESAPNDMKNESALDRNPEIMFKVHFIQENLGTFFILCSEATAIKTIKQTIHDTQGLSIANQRITHEGTQLEDDKTLADYNIREESTLVLRTHAPFCGKAGLPGSSSSSDASDASGNELNFAALEDYTQGIRTISQHGLLYPHPVEFAGVHPNALKLLAQASVLNVSFNPQETALEIITEHLAHKLVKLMDSESLPVAPTRTLRPDVKHLTTPPLRSRCYF